MIFICCWICERTCFWMDSLTEHISSRNDDTNSYSIYICVYLSMVCGWIASGCEAHSRNNRHYVNANQHLELTTHLPSQGIGWPGRRFIHLASESLWVGLFTSDLDDTDYGTFQEKELLVLNFPERSGTIQFILFIWCIYI